MENSVTDATRRNAWNKGKLIGPKPPLQPKHVWAIRTQLHLKGRVRDLALFNLAIDSKLRGCDLVSLRVGDIAPYGHAVSRTTIRQSKTGRPVQFELMEGTRASLDAYLQATGRRPWQYLFGASRELTSISRPGSTRGLSTDGSRWPGLTPASSARTRCAGQRRP